MMMMSQSFVFRRTVINITVRSIIVTTAVRQKFLSACEITRAKRNKPVQDETRRNYSSTYTSNNDSSSSSPSTLNSNSSNNQKHRSYQFIPSPTWSVQDLELTLSHPPLPEEEFKKLARLVLLDVSSSSSRRRSSNNDNNNDSLRQDLGNMLHMIQQVTEYQYPPSTKSSSSSSSSRSGSNSSCNSNNVHDGYDTVDSEATYDDSSKIYDAVRGVKAAPLRRGLEDDPLQLSDTAQAQDVWENFVQPKTMRKGGSHVYFAIKTNNSE